MTAPDGGAAKVATRYMGECPAGDGRINATYLYVEAGGAAWHAHCAPEPRGRDMSAADRMRLRVWYGGMWLFVRAMEGWFFAPSPPPLGFFKQVRKTDRAPKFPEPDATQMNNVFALAELSEREGKRK